MRRPWPRRSIHIELIRQWDECHSSGYVVHMSPEQSLGEDEDGRSDIFSLGVTIDEIATGTLPSAADEDAVWTKSSTEPR